MREYMVDEIKVETTKFPGGINLERLKRERPDLLPHVHVHDDDGSAHIDFDVIRFVMSARLAVRLDEPRSLPENISIIIPEFLADDVAAGVVMSMVELSKVREARQKS